MRKIKDYEAAFYGVLFGIGVLCLWYFTSFVVEGQVIPKYADYVISGLITLFTTGLGAAYGARVAFKFQKKETNEIQISNQVGALSSSIFILIQQINYIESFIGKIEENDTVDKRAFLTPRYLVPELSKFQHDLKGLNFLMAKGKGEILLNLDLEQYNFIEVMETIKKRNKHFNEIVHPILEKNSLIGVNCTVTTYKNHLGPVYDEAISLLISMYDVLIKAQKTSRGTFDVMILVAKELFPNDYHKWIVQNQYNLPNIPRS